MQLASVAGEAIGPETPEQELVALARGRREDAVRELVQRHNRQLFRIARGIVKDDAEAEDIVQETYVRAFIDLEGFRGQSSFATWLTRIALNEAVGRLRHRRPTEELSHLDRYCSQGGGQVLFFPGAASTDTPEEQLGRNRVRRLLEEAVDGLPEPFRLVFILRDVEGLTAEETAAALSLKTVTVRTRLFRARRMMRRSIEKTVASGFAELFPFGGERCKRMADRVLARITGLG